MPPPAAPVPLLDRRFLVLTGKGGVGKSTLTAALALAAARRGKRVLACEVNADDRLPALLGAKPVGPRIAEIQKNLWCVNIRPHEAMVEYGLMKLKSGALVHAVLENRVMRYFLNALPSLAEVVTMGKILFHVREQEGGRDRFDVVLLDAPATGHGLGLLSISRSVLGTVPPGPLHDDMRWMAELLEDPARTAVHLVTLPEELPVSETLELNASLREARLPRGVCLLNGVWPNRVAPGELDSLPREPALAPVRAAVERMQLRADLGAAEARRLREGIDLPVLELPQLFVSDFGLAAIERLAKLLDPHLGEPAAAVTSAEEAGSAGRRAEAAGRSTQ
ncbi:MAG TPA: ArsA-related P-loop ATPase [Myxococcales bacterium]|nr:ArsA-related P-loop ATPase [Myxococcales bacterium]